jgi:uncharacterized caspase-like protein
MVVYISGHGIRDDDGHLYFAAPDTDMDSLDATAVSASFVNRHLGRSPSERVVLLLDCCFSGAFAAGMLSKSDGTVQLGQEFQGQGRAVLTSSRATEYSFEGGRLTDNRARPSAFTDVLIQGLRTGAADRDRDGWVSLDELYSYVHDGVRRLGPRQTPTRWYFGVEGDRSADRRRAQVRARARVPQPP